MTGPKKRQFPETDEVVFMVFQEKDNTGINCTLLFLWHVQWLYHFSKMPLLTMNLIHMLFESASEYGA
jgi:hypothetical protein